MTTSFTGTPMNINNAPFCIDEDAYCVWDDELDVKNVEFLSTIRPQFFLYLAKQHETSLLQEADAQFAAAALRIAYAQAAETAVALTFAAIQAPLCAYAWLEKYRGDRHLDALCEKVRSGTRIRNRLRIQNISWRTIVQRVFLNAPTELVGDSATADRDSAIEGYTFALERIAGDYSDSDIRREYNAFKHGFRVSPGGFTLAFRAEKALGVEDPEAPLHVLGASKFGSRTFAVERIGDDKHNLRVEMRSLNWDAHAVAHRIAVAAAWMMCVKACLLSELAKAGTEITWSWLQDLEAYKKPWSTSVGSTRFTLRTSSFEVRSAKGPSAEAIRATYDGDKTDGPQDIPTPN
jgi:hypothetical protein